MRTVSMAACVLSCLGILGCDAQAPASSTESGFGTLAVSLSGALPDVLSLRLRLYDAPPGGGGKIVYDTGCRDYTAQNVLTVSPLKTGSNYALVVDLYQAAQCVTPRFRAYRGAITVSAQSDIASQARPYYLQPYEFGKFTGLAQVSSTRQAEAAKRSCSQDADCKIIHPNATCSLKQNVCTIDHLFPLNGAVRRAFPLVLALDDGRVAVGGGLNAQIQGDWQATSDRVEVFDPATGLFTSEDLSSPPFAVGLAEGVTVAGGSYVQVAGTGAAKFSFEKGKQLGTGIQAKGCAAGVSSTCKVYGQVARIDPKANASVQTPLGSPLAFPIVARVHTPQGDRVLVAGGAKVPLPLGGDARTGQAALCKVEAGQVPECTATGAPMQAGRARAAVACVEGGAACTKVLVLGGRTKVALPLAEVYDATTDTFTPVQTKGAVTDKDKVHGGQLLPLADGSWLLVGASRKALFLEDDDVATGADLPALRVQFEASPPTLTFSAVQLSPGITQKDSQRVLGSAVGLADRSVLLIGGIDTDLQARADAILFSPTGQAMAKIELGGSRFGGGAGLIGGKGPVSGCVLLAGGFTLVNGVLQPQNHVEVFCPGAP